ncbi:putative PPE protein [Mycobacterium xenopi 3993]|nr:putative PPE protein [Mycobacterium xenopi 3993]
MWAQDAAAMYGYAGSSSAATQMTPFSPPPQTTSAAGTADQAAAVARATGTSGGTGVQSALSQLISLVPSTLQSLAATATSTSASSSSGLSGLQSSLSSLSTLLSNATGAYSPIGLMAVPGGWWLTAMQALGLAQNGPGVASLLGPQNRSPECWAAIGWFHVRAAARGPGRGAVSGAWAEQAWSAAFGADELGHCGARAQVGGNGDAEHRVGAAPAIAADGQAGLFSDMALSSLAGRAIGGTATRSIGGTASRVLSGAAEAAPTTATIIVIPPAEQ